MQRVLAEAWQSSARICRFRRHPHEALTLASIMEKECDWVASGAAARIAGVFVTRLRKGMRLQTDPTVIYGLGAGYDGDIRTRDS